MRTSPAPAAPDGAGWRAGVAAMTALLGPLDQHVCSDRERIDAIDALRGLIAAAGAAQVRLTAAYALSQKSLGASARGVAAEVGFAQRVGIAQAQRLVASSLTLTADLPETLELVSEGELSVERARVVADRVADAEPQVRHVVDDRISGEVDLLADRQIRDAVDVIVMQIDADHIERRRLAAFQRRRVSVRPVGDGMAWLSILTTLVDAAHAEQMLRQHADQALAASESETARSQGARMVDAAIDRLTGRVEGVGPQVAVHLVMTPDTLTGTGPGREMPAHVLGVGPLPARAARDLLKVASTPEGTTATSPTASTVAAPTHTDGTAEPPPEDACASTTSSFEGPAWDFDDTVRDQRLSELERIERRAQREAGEASRVTVRRIFVDADGRTFTGMDKRVGVMPAPFRQRLGDPDGDADGAMSAWLSLLRRPPKPEDLVPLDSMARLFMGLLRRFLQIRDKTCRAPWCGAPIRHVDHAHPFSEGGTTCVCNGQCLCVGHNLAKESIGYWVRVESGGFDHSSVESGGFDHSSGDYSNVDYGNPGYSNPGYTARPQPHRMRWVSPTGLTWTSTAAPPLGWGTVSPEALKAATQSPTGPSQDVTEDDSPLERRFAALLAG